RRARPRAGSGTASCSSRVSRASTSSSAPGPLVRSSTDPPRWCAGPVGYGWRAFALFLEMRIELVSTASNAEDGMRLRSAIILLDPTRLALVVAQQAREDRQARGVRR